MDSLLSFARFLVALELSTFAQTLLAPAQARKPLLC